MQGEGRPITSDGGEREATRLAGPAPALSPALIREMDRQITLAWFRANATPQQKAAAMRDLKPIHDAMPTAVEREAFLRDIARDLGIGLEALHEDTGTEKPREWGPAPEDPDEYLAWCWRQNGGSGRAPTWEEYVLSLGEEPTPAAREGIVRWASIVREWQRAEQSRPIPGLGRD